MESKLKAQAPAEAWGVQKTISYPKPRQLFNSSVKDEAIVMALTRLASLTKATPEAGLLLAYADNLLDLTPEQLTASFERAERECEFFPTVPQLRRFAGEARERLAAERAAEAARKWANRPACKLCQESGWMLHPQKERVVVRCPCRTETEDPPRAS